MLNKTVLMAGTIVMTVGLGASAFAADSGTGTMKTDDAMQSDMNTATDKAAEGYKDAKDFTYEQKNEFLAWVEEKSDQLGDKYDEMSAGMKQNSEDAVDELAEAWDDASDNLSDAYDDAKDATADSWEDVKASTMDALNKAEKALSDENATE